MCNLSQYIYSTFPYVHGGQHRIITASLLPSKLKRHTAPQHTTAMGSNTSAPGLLVSAAYLGFLLPHAVDAGGQLDGVERVGVVGGGVRDVGDHGGPAVDVPQGLPQQHGQLAVPGSVCTRHQDPLSSASMVHGNSTKS